LFTTITLVVVLDICNVEGADRRQALR
jgi:hypothetical protein